jgi:hypothetical protein
MKLNQIENLIKLTKDNVRLLEELKQAIQRENSDCFIKSWLKKRKIPINKVFTKSCWEHIISSED